MHEQAGAAPAGAGEGAHERAQGGTPVAEERLFELPEGFHSEPIRALVERAQKGDVDALNELFGSCYNLMVEMARRRLGPRLRQKEDADDLAQTTFREATRDFGGYVYRGEGSLLSWLARILQNKIRDRAEFYGARKRDVSRERTLEERAPNDGGEPRAYDPASEDLSVTTQVQRKEEFAILRDTLERLSPEHRQAITLVFFEGRSLRQAGELMGGRSEDAVRMLVRRAERHLFDMIRSKVDPTS